MYGHECDSDNLSSLWTMCSRPTPPLSVFPFLLSTFGFLLPRFSDSCSVAARVGVSVCVPPSSFSPSPPFLLVLRLGFSVQLAKDGSLWRMYSKLLYRYDPEQGMFGQVITAMCDRWLLTTWMHRHRGWLAHGEQGRALSHERQVTEYWRFVSITNLFSHR